ncbi:hypothetical protein D3368_14135 [Salmonella enterica]|nr:hypothetical protein [Salmonella enterica]EDU5370224.1 hypothetical protein [Salmonella enterica subsp. enterica serovar Urbana]EAO8695190.1 hypothetical protein [Salmonella enterica]EAV3574055.1 hypothetical protein [Salmonella enterica]EBK1187116.1 hypothetical protein [Salmonella enterica]
MTALNKQALRDSAIDMIRVLGYIASFESEDIDGDDLELRFETEDGFDTGCTISITSQCQDAADVMQQLLNELEAAEKTSAARLEAIDRTHKMFQRERDRADAAEKRIAEQSAIVAAAERLVRCKGRYHSEQNYRALAALFGVTTPDLPPLEHENVHFADAAEMEISALRQHLAELEARTVTMPPKEHDNGTDSQIDINAGFANRMWQKCADAIRAAGIGVKGK